MQFSHLDFFFSFSEALLSWNVSFYIVHLCVCVFVIVLVFVHHHMLECEECEPRRERTHRNDSIREVSQTFPAQERKQQQSLISESIHRRKLYRRGQTDLFHCCQILSWNHLPLCFAKAQSLINISLSTTENIRNKINNVTAPYISVVLILDCGTAQLQLHYDI